MIGNDDNQEEVQYKVADKRKFNSDGSLREGVTLEPAKAVEPSPPESVEGPSVEAVEGTPDGFVDETSSYGAADEDATVAHVHA